MMAMMRVMVGECDEGHFGAMMAMMRMMKKMMVEECDEGHIGTMMIMMKMMVGEWMGGRL